MAQIVRRPRSDGGVTWQVKWRLGGTRDGAWQAESFTHEGRVLAFKADVEDAGHHWPDGWINGEGYVSAQPREPDATFSDVRDAYWRAQERRVLRGRLKPHSLSKDKRTAALHLADFDGLPFTDIDVEDIEAWVDRQLTSGASPKSIRNRHGLLAAIMRLGP